MTISATVICDSLSAKGKRITTLQLKYPRFIHAEFLTHRAFSRNSASSRAIPVERMIKMATEDPAMPVHWGKNQPGMQAKEEHTDYVPYEYDWENLVDVYGSREKAWLHARDNAVRTARAFARAGYHKQIVNRHLEPYVHMEVVCTSTEWENFFNLRHHEDAQPEIYSLSAAMKIEIDNSTPVEREWHIPYIDPLNEYDRGLDHETSLKVSVARCARVSYKTFDGNRSVIEKDLEIYDKLVSSEPFHASPTEHQARDLNNRFMPSRNFYGWEQYRAILGV